MLAVIAPKWVRLAILRCRHSLHCTATNSSSSYNRRHWQLYISVYTGWKGLYGTKSNHSNSTQFVLCTHSTRCFSFKLVFYEFLYLFDDFFLTDIKSITVTRFNGIFISFLIDLFLIQNKVDLRYADFKCMIKIKK